MHLPRVHNACLNLCSAAPSSSSLGSVFIVTGTRRSIATTISRFTRDRCYYAVLGVTRTASQAEIKKAFYEKSKMLHPDLQEASADSTAAFVELKTAYDTLRRPADRRVYDHRDDMAERARERAMHRHAYRPSVHPHYQGPESEWQSFFRQRPGARPGGEENMSESEIFKRREEQWKLIMKWTIIGAAAVILYNTGYVIQLRLREHRLSQLIESEEIAKSFLRQPEFKNRYSDASERENIAAMLTKDVDEAYRRKCEQLRETKNPDEIREEYRWMRAVEDAGRYQRYRERRDHQAAERRAAAAAQKANEEKPAS